MNVLRPILLFAVFMLSMLGGCTPFDLATTGITSGVSIGVAKHGWFDANAKLTTLKDLKIPVSPPQLSLHTRIIVQGIDLDEDGALENSVSALMKDDFIEQVTEILEKNHIADITKDGKDGSIYVEVSDTMEDFGTRYIPLVTAVRWTERKSGKMRVTLRNREGKKVSSNLQNEFVYVISGFLSDDPDAPHKQAAFEISRSDYTLEGETVGLDQLNEQLFLRCLKKIQDKVDLNLFFAMPEAVVSETKAPDPKEGWEPCK